WQPCFAASQNDPVVNRILQNSSSIPRLIGHPNRERGVRMKPKSITMCAFAGAILASTVGAANSSPLHMNRATHYSHARVAGLGTYHRVLHRSHVALRRTHGVAGSEHATVSEKPGRSEEHT